MKYLAFILIVFLSCNNIKGQENCYNGIIKFEYAGTNSDKPIRSIFITANNKLKAENTDKVDMIYVSNKTYKIVDLFVKSKQTTIKKTLTLTERESLGLLISIEEDNKNKKYSLLNRGDAVMYLNELKKKLLIENSLNKQQVNAIIQSINVFTKRINW
ncbi:hypothetical protein F0919_03840 [Taibaiella lutea]|uniref:Uncharacterized protein n=1 Tax=Taibaiella lutea TaxID=2608001 RepID=A0A5M6CS77_9BACT|nr:hypothetical protein [Taibaiella lutea]KAA5536812.1 hypothetical protein F0919_03840 [Taibaiella lutea]